jgi:hypothetical protein
MKTFKIYQSDNFDTYITLGICSTRKQMLEEVRKYKAKNHESYDLTDITVGAFCQTPTLKLEDDILGELSSNIWGMMFLNLRDIKEYGDEIIIHECAHAVFAYDKTILRLKNGYDDMEIQEHFCYMQGKLIKAIRQILDDNYTWHN